MTGESKIEYHTIGGAPASELLKLSHEELDDFIAQAEEIRRSATLIIDWLIAIKFEKTVREEAADGEKRGEA